MSDVEEFRQSSDKEIEECEQFETRAKDILDLIPAVQERKEEAKAKRAAFEAMTDEKRTEFASMYIRIQREDEARLDEWLPSLPETKRLRIESAISTSGSAFYEAAQATMGEDAGTLADIFRPLAEKKSKKASLRNGLEAIDRGLSEDLEATANTAEQAKAKAIGFDLAQNRFRSVIQRVWRGLAAHARRKCPDRRWPNSIELKREAHRTDVAGCLAQSRDETRLKLVLDTMSRLYQDLSAPSKQMTDHDALKFEQFYEKWLLVLDNLLPLLDLPS